MEDRLNELTKKATQAGFSVQIDKTPDGSLMECTLKKGALGLYISIPEHGNDFVAYSLSSEALPRELYPESLRAGFSEIERSEEIFSNVEALISKTIKFQPKPSLFRRQRGLIEITVDGQNRIIYMTKNYFDLPRNAS